MAATGAVGAHAEGHDTLTIGIAQFPSSLHPDIDAEVVRSYAMGFVIRQITAFDADWKNSCLLCTELPTLENGLAKLEDRPDGKQGLAVTIKLKPGLQWGDGQPVTANDIAFTWKLGRDPYLLESSVPGVFVAGDVRHGSVKRAASAVGEGSIAVQFAHQYLAGF